MDFEELAFSVRADLDRFRRGLAESCAGGHGQQAAGDSRSTCSPSEEPSSAQAPATSQPELGPAAALASFLTELQDKYGLAQAKQEPSEAGMLPAIKDSYPCPCCA